MVESWTLTAILLRRVILGLVLLDSRVVVDEDICAVVLGIRIASSSLIARTEIALLRPSTLYFGQRVQQSVPTYRLVVLWQLNLACGLLLALPWPLRPVRAYQDPASSQCIVPAV